MLGGKNATEPQQGQEELLSQHPCAALCLAQGYLWVIFCCVPAARTEAELSLHQFADP